MWDLAGMYVEGLYMGDIPVLGRVESSRVKYGGGIQHTVVLDQPITVYSAVRDRVLLDHENVTRVYDNQADFRTFEDARYDDQFELDTDYN